MGILVKTGNPAERQKRRARIPQIAAERRRRVHIAWEDALADGKAADPPAARQTAAKLSTGSYGKLLTLKSLDSQLRRELRSGCGVQLWLIWASLLLSRRGHTGLPNAKARHPMMPTQDNAHELQPPANHNDQHVATMNEPFANEDAALTDEEAEINRQTVRKLDLLLLPFLSLLFLFNALDKSNVSSTDIRSPFLG